MHKDCIILIKDFDLEEMDKDICLTSIDDKPFLEHLAKQLKKHHICKVIFALGNCGTTVKEYILNHREAFDFAFDFSETKNNLGSGGAIMDALQYSDTNDVLIVNGWQYNSANLDDVIAWQQTKYGDVTIAAKYLKNTRNYQALHINEKHLVFDFSPRANNEGIINTGVYCMFRPSFLNINFPQSFSFNKDFIEKQHSERDIIGMVQDGLFYDMQFEEDRLQFTTYLNKQHAEHK